MYADVCSNKIKNSTTEVHSNPIICSLLAVELLQWKYLQILEMFEFYELKY